MKRMSLILAPSECLHTQLNTCKWTLDAISG